MKDSYKRVQKVTSELKKKFAFIYAAYCVTFYATLFLPRFIPRLCVHDATMKFTCAFSNVPGPIKPFKYTDSKGNLGFGRFCFPYIMLAGRVGLAISCLSFGDMFAICISADEAVMKDTEVLVEMMEKAIDDEIERVLPPTEAPELQPTETATEKKKDE